MDGQGISWDVRLISIDKDTQLYPSKWGKKMGLRDKQARRTNLWAGRQCRGNSHPSDCASSPIRLTHPRFSDRKDAEAASWHLSQTDYHPQQEIYNYENSFLKNFYLPKSKGIGRGQFQSCVRGFHRKM